MDKRILQKSLEHSAGGSLVSIAEVTEWSGRSRDYVKRKMLFGVESVKTGKQRLFFSGDVAAAIVEKKERYGFKNEK